MCPCWNQTAWWPSGLVKEEEYWDEGTYKGRRMGRKCHCRGTRR